MTTRSTLRPVTAATSAMTSDPAAISVGAGVRRIEPRRFRAVLRPFRTPVRGHAFAAAPTGGGEPEPGSRARLAREPGNPADPLAVAVWVETDAARTWRIGYLDRGVAARVAPRIDAGLHLDVSVEGWVAEPEGRWHRPLVLLVPEAGDEGAEPSPAGEVSGGAAEAVSTGAPGGSTRDRGVADQLWGRPPGVSRRVVRPS